MMITIWSARRWPVAAAGDQDIGPAEYSVDNGRNVLDFPPDANLQ